MFSLMPAAGALGKRSRVFHLRAGRRRFAALSAQDVAASVLKAGNPDPPRCARFLEGIWPLT